MKKALERIAKDPSKPVSSADLKSIGKSFANTLVEMQNNGKLLGPDVVADLIEAKLSVPSEILDNNPNTKLFLSDKIKTPEGRNELASYRAGRKSMLDAMSPEQRAGVSKNAQTVQDAITNDPSYNDMKDRVDTMRKKVSSAREFIDSNNKKIQAKMKK